MVQVDPKSGDSCPYTRKTEVNSRQKRRRKRRSPCDHEAEVGGTHSHRPAMSPGVPGGPRRWKKQEGSSPRASEGSIAGLTPASRTSGLKAERGYVSAVLRHPVCGLSQRSQASNTDP